jgi:ABC-2 type transport system permease protein
VRSVLLAELLKLRTTRSLFSLASVMLGLVILAVGLHGLGLPVGDLDDQSGQLRVAAFGVNLGTVFAALLGALSIVVEHRHGTIRTTVLGVPDRTRVILSKAIVAAATGLGLGVGATGAAIVTLHVTLGGREIPIQLAPGDYAQMLVGAAAGAALWSVIGLGLGAVIRNQMPSIVGIFLWLFVIENLLIDSVPDLSRYLPGSLAQGLAGSPVGTLDTPGATLALLAAYAAGTLLLAAVRFNRADVA